MATQEERLTTLEHAFTKFQKETVARIQEIEENTTILLGVIRSQGRDIRRIMEQLETINQRFEQLEQRFDRQEAELAQHTSLLTQILAKLSEKP